MRNSILLIILILFGSTVEAKELDPVKWTYNAQQKGEFTQIIFTAAIEEGWYLYAQDIPEGGPIATSFHFETDNSVTFEPYAEEASEFLLSAYDEMFDMELTKYQKEVIFTFTPEVDESIQTIKGYLQYMCCDGTQCLAPKIIEFNLNLK